MFNQKELYLMYYKNQKIADILNNISVSIELDDENKKCVVNKHNEAEMIADIADVIILDLEMNHLEEGKIDKYFDLSKHVAYEIYDIAYDYAIDAYRNI